MKSSGTGREVIAITHVSLDGVMQAPGGPEEDPSNGFTMGGWTMPYRTEAGARMVAEIIAGDFDLLLGRRTYDIFANYWPKNGEHAIGKAFNRATKYVVSRRPAPLEWKTSVRIGGEVVEGIRRLKVADGPALHVWGSGELLQTLMAAGLVDEHRLWVFPVVLGKGKRLFESGVPAQGFKLVETRSTPSGVLANTYRPASGVKTG